MFVELVEVLERSDVSDLLSQSPLSASSSRSKRGSDAAHTSSVFECMVLALSRKAGGTRGRHAMAGMAADRKACCTNAELVEQR